MFDKILIANRGEIACRIARTARRMGIKTVAVYSQPDCDAPHVRQCDEAYLIGTAAAADSYLCAQRIIDAALKSGAGAVHPGYGFLSENPDFAEACARAGITFIGPPAAAIRAMGNKRFAKDTMAAAGVPVVAGWQGEEQSAQTLKAAADDIGYPVLLKAACGGGGKGMRIVRCADAFAESLASVKRESSAAFGDDRVLIEKYLTAVRHVEVQIFADCHGHTVHLFERDCSIQRRHQKVIEEAPAPGVGGQLRKKIGAAAVDAANAIGYVGAGTVEFLLTPDARFYFMEMNTRLQVEHPVTEMITGQDLVEWQLRVAAGLPLPCRQQDLRINGHAMEARICAENPGNDFLPATGTLAVYRPAPARDWLRVDTGVAQGDRIPPHYDSLIAKLIVWGRDRVSAGQRLGAALTEFDIAGVATNLGFLHALTELDDFRKPALDTGLIPRNAKTLLADAGDAGGVWLAIASLFELGEPGTAAGPAASGFPPGRRAGGDPFSPWSPAVPWQLNLPAEATCAFAAGSGEVEYTIRFERGRRFGLIDGARQPVALTALDDGRFRFQCGAHAQTVSVDKVADTIHVRVGGRRRALTIAGEARAQTERAAADAGLAAPMPGTVIEVVVKEKQRVKRGAPLLVLEAMKMEHTIRAPHDGRVKQLFFRRGEQVREGDPLLSLAAAED